MPATGQTNVAFGGIKADPTLPVEVTADSLDVNQADGSAEFKGNVRIGQGEMRISAQRVLVIYNQDQSTIQRMEAVGDVVLVSGPDAAEADRADYSIDTGVIVMTGNVLLTQGANALSSNNMTVNLTTGTAQMNGRVRTILQNDGGN
ncbi:lipopolysaccharide transport periplasmic protein LptA [Phaeobacter sp. 22II1-1F12B]|uniref:lipopolysaccharide transport periplasmic protein LptA n=1 Tax=Roseobacteraceae TaxID=2854170 RepID=UPI000B521877|nr:lipopolysaccharide transport periplasmic protein LptA [Phaeobacter sp. 22II1-1F12B]